MKRALPILGLSFVPVVIFSTLAVLHFVTPSALEYSISGAITVHQNTVGTSTSGRPIESYSFGNGDQCLLLMGAIHGNEKGTKELLDLLVKKLSTHPQLVHPHNTVIIIPLANPDGYYDRTDKLNARGVNLNRNFATEDWIRQEDRRDPETYAGEAPFSEQESRVFREVAQNCQNGILIAFHSQGALVSPEASEESLALGQWYAEQTGYSYYTEWEYAGTATRWFVESFGLPAITVELTSHKKHDWQINKNALLALIGTGEWSALF